jgi:uncharacterized protein (TIGR02246 family)
MMSGELESQEAAMKRTRARATAVVFLLVSFPFAISWAKKSDAADSAAIKQVVSDFVDAFNNHDAHAWAMPFAEDGDFTNVTGLTRHGRKEFEERFAGLFAGPLKNAHRTYSVKSIRFLSPEIASVDADWEMTGSKAADGSENPVRKGLFHWIMTRQNDHWLFAAFHEFEFAPTPSR